MPPTGLFLGVACACGDSVLRSSLTPSSVRTRGAASSGPARGDGSDYSIVVQLSHGQKMDIIPMMRQNLANATKTTDGMKGWQGVALGDDLSHLRKGRGVMASDLLERVGPALKALSGIDDACTEAEARRRLIVFLNGLASELPPDLGLALATSLAVHEEVRHRFLEERVRWLATKLQRDVRTARRRIDEAIRCAEGVSAATSAAGGDYAPEGWYLARLRTLLSLDGPRPTAIEERTVVANQDDLSEIIISTSIPRAGTAGSLRHTVDLTVIYGGSLALREQRTDTYFRHVIRLPQSLRRGESHEIGVSVAVPVDQPMKSRYAFKPLRRCDEFDLRIRFSPLAPAMNIWSIHGLPQGMIEDFATPDAIVRPDSAGEVHLRYQHLRVGLAYGARWES